MKKNYVYIYIKGYTTTCIYIDVKSYSLGPLLSSCLYWIFHNPWLIRLQTWYTSNASTSAFSSSSTNASPGTSAFSRLLFSPRSWRIKTHRSALMIEYWWLTWTWWSTKNWWMAWAWLFNKHWRLAWVWCLSKHLWLAWSLFPPWVASRLSHPSLSIQ